MAMDKEKLLTYFQDHYLSRREVLFKLPLSMSIDTFWPELLNRRKAKATMLPLYGASGAPYWYVLTEKMIAASEKLCEEAMSQDENFDPYRARMTSAMTEEMFFTSFVEGAQIPLNEAMDFLQRGTEPENIQEQMIWNNRQAWSAMANALYKPLDEPFVKSLAFMLTDEMVGRADDYRQTDKHVVAAMNEETYEVPPASCIADRMRGYYDLLRSPDMHPLIKAAIGQAYLLTTRPFLEGNERLSRMISSAVLLRSGYGYFRDISISSHIARENYRYYQAMCDVLRSENGNDLTYFIEYYLDLLARALDAKKDRDKRRELQRDKEALGRERELALQPLGINPQTPKPGTESLAEKPQTVDFIEPQPVEPDVTESPPKASPYDTERLKECRAILDKVQNRPTERIKRVTRVLQIYFEQGVTAFSRSQWQEATGVDIPRAGDDCYFMLKHGITVSAKNGKNTVYKFTCVKPGSDSQFPSAYIQTSSATSLIPSTALDTSAADPYAAIRVTLRELLINGAFREKRVASSILGFLDAGMTSFSYADWAKRTTLSDSVNHEDLRLAQNCDLLILSERKYTICTHVDLDRRYNSLPETVGKVLQILIASFSEQSFTVFDAARRLSKTNSAAAYYLDQLKQRGIIRPERANGNSNGRLCFTEEYLLRRKSMNITYESVNSSVTIYKTSMIASGVSA